MERTRILPCKPSALSGKIHAPRIIKSICTPLRAASIRALTNTSSVSEFILAIIFALPPSKHARLAALILRNMARCKLKGATNNFRIGGNTVWLTKCLKIYSISRVKTVSLVNIQISV